MIRFIDLGYQATNLENIADICNPRQFAFYDDDAEDFIRLSDVSIWGCWDELEDDWINSDYTHIKLDTLKALCPGWVFGDQEFEIWIDPSQYAAYLVCKIKAETFRQACSMTFARFEGFDEDKLTFGGNKLTPINPQSK